MISTPTGDALPQRLAALRVEFTDLIAEFRPDAVAVEQVFFQVNVRTAMGVGQASGLALAEAAIAGCEVVQYTPNQVKDAVAGYGSADKAQVQKMVQARLGLSALPKPADAADAAAVALCHLAMSPLDPRGVRELRVIGSLRGSVLERNLDGTVLIEVERGRLPRDGVDTASLAELEPGTPVFLYVHHHIREDAQTLYGFSLPRRPGDVPGAHRHPRHRAGARRGDPGDASAVGALRRRGEQRCRRAHAGARHRQEDRRTADRRTARPALGPDARHAATAARCRRSPTCAMRCRAWATAPTRSATCLRELADRLRFVDAPARRAQVAGGAPCVTSSSTRASAAPTTAEVASEIELEAGLRPRALDEFVGQRELKEHLRIVLEAARKREQSVDHLLFAGPPGLGKTTLAGIVATEMGVHLHVTSGPALERAGDLAAILTKLEDGDVLFIDEIHRLSRAVEEILYPAMEDFQLDIVVGKGPAASSIRLTMPPFTLVGATTRTGMITGPLRDRFGLVARLDYYDSDELQAIVERAAGIIGVDDRSRRCVGDRPPVTRNAAHRQPAAAAGPRLRRGPRRRGRSMRPSPAKAWRCSVSTTAGSTRSTGRSSPRMCTQFNGGPVGLSTVAISVGEQPETVEDMYEPFLITQGMIARTPRGRVALDAAYEHLGLTAPRARSRARLAVRLTGPRWRLPRRGSGSSPLVACRRAVGRLRLRASRGPDRADADRAARFGTAARRSRRRPRRASVRPRSARPAACGRSARAQRDPGHPGPACGCAARPGAAAEVLLLESIDPAIGAAGRRSCGPAASSLSARNSHHDGEPLVRMGERTAAGDTFFVELTRPTTDPLTCSTTTARCRCRRTSASGSTDPDRYQTVFAREPGSARRRRRVCTSRRSCSIGSTPSVSRPAKVELVVGLDTFQPISTEDPLDHPMHTERYRVPPETTRRRAMSADGSSPSGPRRCGRSSPRRAPASCPVGRTCSSTAGSTGRSSTC